ncbi:MAG TPA: prenyltransferase [Miltoncostaeaceae bacterium]|nr:prenyltransferase [Miltoncostaeaceae bacterium]
MAGLRRVLLGLWLEIRVIPVLLWSFTAITLGTALAWRDGDGVAVGGYLAAVAVGVLLQGLVAHCVNEIADWRSGTDRDPAPRVISGGSKVIASGLLGTRELRLIGIAAAVAATILGILAAAEWGWILLAYGAVGLAGAVLYTLPPVRAAYRPFAGEAVAFACIWGCTTGAYVLQRGELSGGAALAGIAYAASCVAMLMMHHYLDRIPDSRALPPKTTTVVLLGRAGRRYAVVWAVIALVGACLLTALVDDRFVIAAVALAAALAVHVGVDPSEPASVTRAELAVIVLGMAGGLGTAAALAPPLLWALGAAAVLVPLELVLSGLAHRDLMAARSERSSRPPGGGPAGTPGLS